MFSCFHYYLWICDLWSVDLYQRFAWNKNNLHHLRFFWVKTLIMYSITYTSYMLICLFGYT